MDIEYERSRVVDCARLSYGLKLAGRRGSTGGTNDKPAYLTRIALHRWPISLSANFPQSEILPVFHFFGKSADEPMAVALDIAGPPRRSGKKCGLAL